MEGMVIKMKILQILIFIVVFIVGIIVIIGGFALLFTIISRWREKGVSPWAKYVRNKKTDKLTDQQQRGINIGAILAEINNNYCNSLTSCKPKIAKNIRNILLRDWEIISKESAVEALEQLKVDGYRSILNLVLENSHSFPSSEHFLSNIYKLTGMKVLKKSFAEKYEKEIAVLEKNIDIMFDTTSYEDAKKHKALFGDNETFEKCMIIYQEIVDRCNLYYSLTNNLLETRQVLEKNGFTYDLIELSYINTTAWDMGRLVNIARYCYDCGYISENEAWEYIFFAQNESARYYSNWKDFANAYIIARAIWGGDNMSLSIHIDTVKDLLKDEKSPWKFIELR